MGDSVRPPPLRQLVDAARVTALLSHGVLGGEREPRFDAVCQVAASALDAPYAYVAFLDADREWVKGCWGMAVDDAPRPVSFCHHTISEAAGTLAVPDLVADARFSAHPAVRSGPMHRSYAGASIVDPGEYRIGVIAVLDRRRRVFGADSLQALQRLADSTMDMLLPARGNGLAAPHSILPPVPGPSPVPDLSPAPAPVLPIQGWLGVRTERAAVPDEGPRGLRLVSVAQQSPAERAGLAAGDILFAIADLETRESGDVTRALSARHVGEPVPVHVWRSGQAVQCMIHVEAMPAISRSRRRSSPVNGG